MRDDRICEGFRKAGVVPQEVPALFMLMDDGDDTLDFCEFLTGIMRLKSARKDMDFVTLLYENKMILKHVHEIGSQVDELRKGPGQRVEADKLKREIVSHIDSRYHAL